MKQQGEVDTRYALFVAIALNLAYAISYLDRQILTLLIDPIKADLGISDTEISLLTGIAFVAIHSLALIPVGHLADHFNRKRIIVCGIGSWSLFTAGCGFANSYLGLFLARMGVGVGEAALVPPAYSMLADYFSVKHLQRAMSIFVIGAPLGAAMALIIGGGVLDLISAIDLTAVPLFRDLRPWQVVFVLVGAMGIPLMLLFSLVREPQRKDLLRQQGDVPASVPWSVIRVFVVQRWRLITLMVGGLALINITAYGALTWLPTLFIRIHGWEPDETGVRLGLISLVFGLAGPIVALRLSRLFHQRGYSDTTMRVSLVGAVVILPASILTPIAFVDWLALALTAPLFLGIYILAGTLPTLIQTIAPNQIRARLSSVIIMLLNLIGLGLGPTVVALSTDNLFGDEAALGYSMALVFSFTMAVGTLLLFKARAPFGLAVLAAQEWQGVTQLSRL